MIITFTVVFNPGSAPQATHDRLLKNTVENIRASGVARDLAYRAAFDAHGAPELAAIFLVQATTDRRGEVLRRLRATEMVKSAHVTQARAGDA